MIKKYFNKKSDFFNSNYLEKKTTIFKRASTIRKVDNLKNN